ncbi:uncharacterized protein LOC129810103 isoform X4 [Phlebotomus papatasi]|uniref:uncharacterized protein LOC129810103 isoform X4 n=1 Tax=Phlebotomus papatasi TaxID=29031 RepID=UPI0024840AA5|nr:uncharacterized protein LOC129810103 isoform X4 [Phlebotomus papatasi]
MNLGNNELSTKIEMDPVKMQGTILFAYIVYVAISMVNYAESSEFPERECCDPIYPPIPNPEPVPPALPTTTISPSSPTPTGRSGPNIKTAIAILNCILARQLCFEDPSCSAILEIIPRVCGPVPVSCSTVTVTKCQAALRTLQAFPFFRPTCLCKEPGVDPECNYFRDFLFDHPCGFVQKKEKDPYPIDALPTCNHALSVCQQERKCIKLFEDFKIHCKVRENKCRMEDRDLCHEAWTNLRLSPMFGCICPNNHMKRRCDRIFSMVNHNPCVVRSMGMDDNFHNRLFDENMVLVDTPLIAPPSSQYSNLYTAGIYPYNLTAFQSGSSMSSMENMLIDTMDNLEKHTGNLDTQIPESSVPELLKIPFQSTCHIVLEACREDPSCSSSLQPVLLHCENHRCNRNACMEALQTFYRAQHEDLSLDIAFCLCKKPSSRQDICLSAQEKLHPICAQKPPDNTNTQTTNGVIYQLPPTCHAVVDLCKEDDECKIRLEQFEQACAIDSVTRKCAGRANICRSALLGILGTSLRTTCSCQGADLQQIYECLGWHKLLWQNPCVVESQKDFHLKRLAELGLLTIPTMPSITTSTTVATFAGITEVEIPLHPIPPFNSYLPTEGPFDTNYIEASESYSDSIIQQHSNELNSSIEVKNGNLSEEQLFVFLTSETTEDDTTISTTTTPKPVPTRYCLVQRAHQNDQQIAEGKSKRLYLLDDPECSELCTCSDGGENPTLSCYALCVPMVPCRTSLAFYSHASPAYQAFRGRCLCYSGRFICMRPPPGEYSLQGGVFLLLGYSSTDEALLRPHTNLGIQDAVRALQQYMIEHINNQTSCTLTLFNMTDENVIISARLPHDPKVNPLELLRREKAQCKSILEAISQHINTQYTELSSDRLLSIFKMAEMQVIIPDMSGSSNTINFHLGLQLLLLFLTILPTIFKLYTSIYHIL